MKNLRALLFTGCLLGLIGFNAAPSMASHQGDGSRPSESELIDGIRSSGPMRNLAWDWKQEITFDNFSSRAKNNWAWVTVDPHTADQKQGFDTVSAVMENEHGQWKLIEFVGDEVSAADDPTRAFASWKHDFRKQHPSCPREIFPEN
jgi:hypothetical protein